MPWWLPYPATHQEFDLDAARALLALLVQLASARDNSSRPHDNRKWQER